MRGPALPHALRAGAQHGANRLRLKGRKRTLWAAITSTAALFKIAPDRHEREAKAILGQDFDGIVRSDRWWAYDHLDPQTRRACWSHLIRDFTAQAEGLAAQKEFGEAALDLARRLFCAWDEFQADGDRARLGRQVAPLKRELKALLNRYASKSKRHKVQAPQSPSATSTRAGWRATC